MDQPFEDVWAEWEDLFGQARQTLASLKESQPAHVVQAGVNALFRTTHTLKGMAGMLGFPSFSRAAHRMEDIFDLMRKGRLRSTDSLVETLEAGMQALESGFDGLKRGRPEPEDYLQGLRRELGELEALARPAAGESQDLSALLDLPAEPLKALSDYERTRVTSALMDGVPIHGLAICLDFATFDDRLRRFSEGLARQGEIISTLPWEVPEEREGLAFMILLAGPSLALDGISVEPGEILESRVLAAPEWVPKSLRAEILAEPEPGTAPAAEPQPEPSPAVPVQETEILRLPAQRVEALEARLMSVAQMRDAVSGLLRKATQAQAEDPLGILGRMEEGLLDVQKALLQMRMVKVDTLFSRLEPMVRTLSRDMGKPVRLTLQGGDLEIERGIVGRLGEPFLHLVRNAMDHGLEPPEERRAMGKSEAGTLRITASRRGRIIRFDIRDDGRGFDLARIEEKGLAMGLLQPGISVSQERLHRLALEPGFSTLDRASHISGRGVGMDVVREEIEAMGGEILLSSEWKRGSLVRLSLPLSRVVVGCLKVRSGGQTFGIPLANVLRVQVGHDLHRGGDRIRVLGMELPFESLQVCLGQGDPPEGQRAFVVLSQPGGSAGASLEIALGVDEVYGRAEILLRSLPELAQVPGIMGGSLQEEGILWVLDPEAVLGLAMDSLMRRVAHA
ncbi:chemotaxis protein CheA [Geothrix rubra]|uniref:histidine kinase n=1 Tax=Geothrix rubra TaxID=2927977 RepID=A0ABQ5Q389_9BACT|nr:Hpt domain-containing protein [Geothrix rubra]GLH69062.1 chemotaxis protein CheA [Geothrix rubra]